MDSLPPIPTPPAQRWREFRIQILPLIVFVVVVLVVAFLWRSFVQPVGVVGEVEAIKANVTSHEDGLLTELTVDLLQPVKAGQEVGRVRVLGDETLRAQLATLEAELRVTGVRTIIDQQRRAQDLAQLRMDLLNERTALSGDTAVMTEASNNFFRVQKVYLSDTNIYSASDYDWYQARFGYLVLVTKSRQETIDQMTKSLAELEAQGNVDVQGPIERAIQAHRRELEATFEPIMLRAPIDGVVSALFHRNGERVLGGAPILTVSGFQSDRIVGYLRQPFTNVPTTNDSVIITTRGQPRRKGEGQILQVGSQIELVRPGVLSPDSNRVETGLPFLVRIPAQMEVTPGELVDLSIRYAKN